MNYKGLYVNCSAAQNTYVLNSRGTTFPFNPSFKKVTKFKGEGNRWFQRQYLWPLWPLLLRDGIGLDWI